MEWFRLGLSNILALRYDNLKSTLRIKPTLCTALTHLRKLMYIVLLTILHGGLQFFYTNLYKTQKMTMNDVFATDN
jgi:hypothetical protein